MKKTILITGASTGIGRATALYFAANGWNVAATMRNPATSDLEETPNLKKIELDVQDKSSIQAAINQTLETFGNIDVLLNNAGYGTAGAFEAATDDQIRRQFDVNVFGLMDTIRGILPHFRERRNGLIINVSSIGGLITFPLFSLYHATKWAVEGLTESLQYELNPLGIQLKIVEPGGVKTDFASRSMDVFDVTNYPDYHAIMQKLVEYRDGNGMDNYAQPEAIAAVIWEAATDGTTQLRYLAGADAKQYWQVRQTVPYDEFRNLVKTAFKID